MLADEIEHLAAYLCKLHTGTIAWAFERYRKEHVRVSRSLARGEKLDDWRILGLRELPAERVDSLCGACHGKLTPIRGRFVPGERLFDHFDLAGLEDLDFDVDGRERGETYTFTSWRMNRCAVEGGLSCVHCHTSSGRYRFGEADANAACLPCHEERVNQAGAHARCALAQDDRA